MREDKYISWAMQTSKKWSDIESVIKYTGIDFVDHDHKTLVEYSLLLNKVLDKSEKAYSIHLIKETEKLLLDIYNYTKDHFDREETFMLEYDLQGFKEHKYEHERILKMLDRVLDNFKQGKINITRYLKIQVLDWLINHINLVDVDSFKVENWSENIHRARTWDDVSDVIKLIGNKNIDEQHKVMTEMTLDAINRLEKECSEKSIDENCERLIDYAKYHFSYEEEFMNKYQIKDKNEHMEIHDSFINMVIDHNKKLKQDKGFLKEMKRELIAWWIEHINKTDSKYFAYANWGYTLLDTATSVEEIDIILKKTGIDEVDEEHIKLMEMTLNLNNLVVADGKTKANKDMINNILKDIYECAKQHFRNEEKIMTQEKMEDLRSHALEHENILIKIMEMYENYNKDRIVTTSNFKNMILEWWINHTNTTDYRTFVLHSKFKKVESSESGGGF